MKKLTYCLVFLLAFQLWTNPVQALASDEEGESPLTVQSIAAGSYAMLALMSDGTVMSWGRNTAGQLGVGTTGNRGYASWVMEAPGEPLSDIIAVSAGSQHSLALAADGSVYSWGHHSMGQIGRTGNGYWAAKITGFGGKRITQISAGDSHSLALDEDGGVWAWGNNIFGQIGDGTSSTAMTPVSVMASASEALGSIRSVAGGQFHSLALTNSGEVLAWGMNMNGQLGDGTQTGRIYPVKVKNGNGSGDLEDVAQVSAMGYNSLALKTDGTLWAWGDNSRGQMGKGNYEMSTRAFPVIGEDGTPFGDVKSMAAGFLHSVAVKNDGTLWTWGSNRNDLASPAQNQLGRSWDAASSPTPGQVLVSEDGTPVSGVDAVAAGNAHTSVIFADGSVWSVGANMFNAFGGNRTESEIRQLARLTMSSRSQSNWSTDTARSAIAGETVTLSFQLADNAGQPLPVGTDQLTMSSDLGTIGPVSYADNGRFTASFRSEQTGASEIIAEVNGIEAIAKLNVEVSAGEPSASQSELKASPASLVADGSSAITLSLELKDEWGNAMTSSLQDVSLRATRGTLGVLTEVAFGQYEAQLTSTEAGASTVSVMLGDTPFDLTEDVHFLSGEPVATGSTLGVDTSMLPADGESFATLELKLYDEHGNALTQSGGEVSFVTDLGQIGTVTESAYGVYTAPIVSLEPGQATITAMRGNTQMGQAAVIDFVPLITRIDFAESKYELQAGTSVNAGVTATYWNQTTGDVTTSATFTVSETAIASVNDSGKLTGNRAGQATLTARLNGLEASVPVTVRSAPSGGSDTSPPPQPTPSPAPDPTPSPTPPPEEEPGKDPSPGETTAFTDVGGHWAKQAIGQAVEKGIVSGYPDGSFRPDGTVTRAEFAVMLARTLGLNTEQRSGANSPRTDDEHWPSWASGSIAALIDRAIIQGYPNGRFEPGQTLNRAEIAAIVVRALELPAAQSATTAYADDQDIPLWARPYIAAATEAGIVQGRSGQRYEPVGTLTRAEAVTLIVRLLDRIR